MGIRITIPVGIKSPPVGALPRAVLWDMDGVLVDSAGLHHRAWREALAEEGHTLSDAYFAQTFGQRNDTILRGIFGEDLDDAAIARIGAAKEKRYRDRVADDGIDPLPGVLGWLRALHEAGWRQAIASAAPRANIDAIVDELNIAGYLSAVVGAEDVARGKPDPQVYLTAAARIEALPTRCVVVEDAPAGIEGAKRAGMRNIGVLTSHEALDAEVVVRWLSELQADAFEKLVPR
jgi:HAD superfamily hydrolase (TIGR01509 family)